jgi:arsenate reductase
MNNCPTVLFVCVHNSGRSQMAEAFFNLLAAGKFVSSSAGTFPSESVNQLVVNAMEEVDIDISDNKPKLLTQDMLDGAQKVITMGCNVEDACPANMIITEDWGLDDPNGQNLDTIRVIRNKIRNKVLAILNEMM